MSGTLNLANTNSLWASVMIEALVRYGITHFIVSPGSRSTPLTVAVAEHPRTTTTVHVDERSAGYFAVGYARGTGTPAVLISTSGTATANYLPAIVEASQDNLPLLVLTADRPPHMWDTGANQTIRQSGIYAHYTRFERTLPVPSKSVPLAYLINTIDSAAEILFSKTDRGPVHLNCPFEKPLEPTPSEEDFTAWLTPITDWLENATPAPVSTEPAGPVAPDVLDRLTHRAMRSTHGLLVFGRESDRDSADVYLKLAECLDWPVWVDIQSPVRAQIDASKRCRLTHDILKHPEISQRWQPNIVLHFGGTLTSQAALDFIQMSQPRDYFHIHQLSRCLDPTGTVTRHIQTSPRHFAQALLQRLSGSEITPTYFETKWCETDVWVVETQMQQESPDIYEAALAYRLSRSLAAESILFVGNSMPIRDFDRYGAFTNGAQVFGNRGASGIDGNIATMAGLAAGYRKPVIGVMGDLAALHDLNSLHLVTQSEHPVILIIINNHGGGIFSQLPISQHENVFEPYFGTPHTYDFQLPARQYGLDYHLINTAEKFINLDEWVCLDRSAIIEIQTNRAKQSGFRQHLSDQVREALNREMAS